MTRPITSLMLVPAMVAALRIACAIQPGPEPEGPTPGTTTPRADPGPASSRTTLPPPAPTAADGSGPALPPDLTRDPRRPIADFACFQRRFAAGDPATDLNGDGTLDSLDLLCFRTRFLLGSELTGSSPVEGLATTPPANHSRATRASGGAPAAFSGTSGTPRS